MTKTLEGKGAFCFPPIRLANDYAQIALERVIDHKRKISLDVKLDDNARVIVTDDGFFVQC